MIRGKFLYIDGKAKYLNINLYSLAYFDMCQNYKMFELVVQVIF